MTPVRPFGRIRPLRSAAVPATALLALSLLLPGCTASPPRRATTPPPAPAPAPAFRLVAFDSCADVLAGLKAAAKKAVGPWGFVGGMRAATPEAWAAGGDLAKDGAMAAAAPDQKSATQPYSDTNTHEAGVDEPDLVKTDGRRIVTVSRGVLRVVDPVSRRVSGRVDLADPDSPLRYSEMSLLVRGDRALVLVPDATQMMRGDITGKPAGPWGAGNATLILVDLSGQPRIIGRYQMDGSLVDARQVAGTVRVVVRAHPRIDFPYDQSGTDQQRLAANRKVIDRSTLTDWLPRFSIIADGRTRSGQVPCDQLSHPPTYSGTSLLTVLSFDLDAPALTDGDPVSVVTDGDTVYGTATSLYVASDQRWRIGPVPADRPQGSSQPVEPNTQIHRFDLTAPGRPRYVASGEVPGWLLNQYAMSEWNGHLRVATTSERAGAADQRNSSSAVYVLRVPDAAGESVQAMREVGRVTGLGRNERIYAVRFFGDTGYVVTFRQTDPLYSLDLRDPARPRVTGELKINGYSAYLHMVGDGRLIGVGQDANDQGRVKGTQISLFDVSDPARPVRIAQHRVDWASSEAEYDPHAFLYWPADRLLVVPLFTTDASGTEALALKVADHALDEAGRVRHPAPEASRAELNTMIRRSLVVGDTLWTVSDAGLMATSTANLRRLAWVPLT